MNRTAGQLRLGTLYEWVETTCTDPDGWALYKKHYSRRVYRDGRDPVRFVGPGSPLVLILPDLSALFVWRKFIDDAEPKQTGINCAVFRNDTKGARLSSDLIRDAEPFAWKKWPQESRLYTYVDPEKTRRKRDPGRCFVRAGWKRLRVRTKGGLVILEKNRDW